VKHITELDALTLMHEWSRLKKENAHLYDYNRQVNRGWRGFVLRRTGLWFLDQFSDEKLR